MERVNRKFWFWVIVLVAVMLPASGETRTKKIFRANLLKNTSGVGSSIISQHASGYDFMVRTFSLPNQVVTKVSLMPHVGGWEVTLCENGGPAGDCAYNASGNLDMSGAITPLMLFHGGATGGGFADALETTGLYILLNGGAEGSGIYVRII